jgi:hypothetical protein
VTSRQPTTRRSRNVAAAVALVLAGVLVTSGCGSSGGEDDAAARKAAAEKAKASAAKQAEAKRVLFCSGTHDLVDTITDLVLTKDLNQVKIDMIDIGNQIEETSPNVPPELEADVKAMKDAYDQLQLIVDKSTTFDDLVAQGATAKPLLQDIQAPLLRFTQYAQKQCPDLQPSTTVAPSAPATMMPVPTTVP